MSERRYVSRYRRVSIKRWQEPAFRTLSDEAKLLLLFLEQGPHTTSLPGLFSAGPAALAEGLGWSPPDFAVAFEELSARGLAIASLEEQLVWLPDCLRDFNAPANPSVLKAWCSQFDELPECALKNEVGAAIGEFLSSLASVPKSGVPAEYAQSWEDHLAHRVPHRVPNQKQKQKKEQEKEMDAPAGAGDRATSALSPSLEKLRDDFQKWWEMFPKRASVGEGTRKDAWEWWIVYQPSPAQFAEICEETMPLNDRGNWEELYGQDSSVLTTPRQFLEDYAEAKERGETVAEVRQERIW